MKTGADTWTAQQTGGTHTEYTSETIHLEHRKVSCLEQACLVQKNKNLPPNSEVKLRLLSAIVDLLQNKSIISKGTACFVLYQKTSCAHITWGQHI